MNDEQNFPLDLSQKEPLDLTTRPMVDRNFEEQGNRNFEEIPVHQNIVVEQERVVQPGPIRVQRRPRRARILPCKDCDQVVRTHSELIEHYKKVHKDLPLFYCTEPDCSIVSTRQVGLDTHIQWSHRRN